MLWSLGTYHRFSRIGYMAYNLKNNLLETAQKAEDFTCL